MFIENIKKWIAFHSDLIDFCREDGIRCVLEKISYAFIKLSLLFISKRIFFCSVAAGQYFRKNQVIIYHEEWLNGSVQLVHTHEVLHLVIQLTEYFFICERMDVE